MKQLTFKQHLIVLLMLFIMTGLMFFLGVKPVALSLYVLGYVWVYALRMPDLEEKSRTRKYRFSSIRFYFFLQRKLYNILKIGNNAIREFVSRVIPPIAFFALVSTSMGAFLPLYWIFIGSVCVELVFRIFKIQQSPSIDRI